MAGQLLEERITCPWCGEFMPILIDVSAGGQSYIEDCRICCRPMLITFTVDDGGLDTLRVDCET